MFSWLVTGNCKVFNKMGYFKDQEGIMNRYIREVTNWKPHLENTKLAILKSSAGKGRGKLAILGSGWLLDVPIEELSARFDQVWLFDIKHPAQINRKVDRYKNVRLVETDISGFAITIFNISQNVKSEFDIDSLKPQFDFDLEGFDMVVSCNILNQLDIILMDYLKKTKKVSSEIESQVRRLIQTNHINLLPVSKSCLISDMEELSIDEENQVVKRKSLIYTDKLSTDYSESWIWQFDNCFSYNSRYNTWFKVIAADI